MTEFIGLVTATLKLNDNFKPIVFTPIHCSGTEIELKCVCGVSLNTPLSMFNIEFELMTGETKMTSVVLPQIVVKKTSPKPLIYFFNQKSFDMLPSGVVHISVALSSSLKDPDAKRFIDPPQELLETSITDLDDYKTPKTRTWDAEAARNGWVSPVMAKAVWERIALKNGWKPRTGNRLTLETRTLADYKPRNHTTSDSDQLMRPIITFHVFEQRPHRPSRDFSPNFDVFKRTPEYTDGDGDTDLNREISALSLL